VVSGRVTLLIFAILFSDLKSRVACERAASKFKLRSTSPSINDCRMVTSLVPTRRQTFGEGAWDNVAEIPRTFVLDSRRNKTL
jgi:hypothetical protein